MAGFARQTILILVAVENLNGALFRMLKDELDNLAIGHAYNTNRISAMKDICRMLLYYKNVDIPSQDVIKIVKVYDY